MKQKYDAGQIIYWQCREFHDMGNHQHNFRIRCVELFNPKKHKDHIVTIVTPRSIKQDENYVKVCIGDPIQGDIK